MKRTLRTTTFHITNITYRNGGYANHLSARDCSIEVLENRIRLSFDMSPNEARGSERSHSFADTKDLKANVANVKFFQFHRDGWLAKGFEWALHESQIREFELEILFKDGTTRALPVMLDVDDHSLWFYAKASNSRTPRPVSTLARIDPLP